MTNGIIEEDYNLGVPLVIPYFDRPIFVPEMVPTSQRIC